MAAPAAWPVAEVEMEAGGSEAEAAAASSGPAGSAIMVESHLALLLDSSKIYLRCISLKQAVQLFVEPLIASRPMADLFADDPPPATAFAEPAADAPLADRPRPRSLEEGVGQEHLTGPEGAIGRMVTAGKLSSLILWGPPGTGKPNIARLLADAVGMRFVALSAVFSGVADLKKVFAEARLAAKAGQRTLLFVDEIHRFNRAQQDGFLPY